MKRGNKKGTEPRPIFDSIRKPTAPPSQKFGVGDAPEEKIHPAKRKAKYKKPPEIDS